MLWEGYVALQKAGGAFDDVRSRMRQYVVSGLLLAPPEATPTEARDAVLAAVYAASPADHDILAAAYARRGFGTCAVSPPRDSEDFIGIIDATEMQGRVALGPVTAEVIASCDRDRVLDAGETARIAVPITNSGAFALSGVAVALSSATPAST